MNSSATSLQLTRLWETPHTLWGTFATVDHKTIGLRYLVTALVFLVLGGLEAVLLRLQLSHSDLHLLGPEVYNQLSTMHGVTMIFWYASPILSGFGNYLLPLMLGARAGCGRDSSGHRVWSPGLSNRGLSALPHRARHERARADRARSHARRQPPAYCRWHAGQYRRQSCDLDRACAMSQRDSCNRLAMPAINSAASMGLEMCI